MKYTKEVLAEVVATSYSTAEVLRRLGLKQTGGSHSHIRRRIATFELDTSHFQGQVRGRVAGQGWNRLLPAELLVVRDQQKAPIGAGPLRRALLALGRSYSCAVCGTITWNGQPLTLEIDHINGDKMDNRPENLRFLCPNCHSQTPTYSNKRRI